MKKLLSNPYIRTLCATLQNIIVSFALFFLARVVYYCINYPLFSHISTDELLSILQGGVVFDLAAVAYINLIYIVIMLLPLHYKEGKGYQRVAKWVFLSLNYVAFISNITDVVYYPFTKRRTTSSVINEFSNDSGVVKVIFDELINRWYLVAICIALFYAVYRLYRTPKGSISSGNLFIYYPLQLLYLAIVTALSVVAIRGGWGADVRPITISNASQYVSSPDNTALVLNTPFAFIRTLGKENFTDPRYFTDSQELEHIFTPIKPAVEQREANATNVVVLIVESLGKECIGALNTPNTPTYTPFLDSLVTESLTFEYSFANGLKSIDGMPSVLSGIPMFVEPFFLTSSSMNALSGVAGELGREGYHTSFFHGAANGSMGFQAFANATGFQNYYGRDDYNNDADFDGRWAIWDEEFLQYYVGMLSSFPQPFASAIFTATSHHPFKVPKRYEGVFPMGEIPIHQCIGYTDNALRLFFEQASTEAWFDSTLFVITADHTSLTAYPDDRTSLSVFEIPIILYQAGSVLKGRSEVIAQQIDIMPTVLNYLGYNRGHLSFGKDLLSTPIEDGYAINYYNGVYQYMEGDWLLQFDGTQSIALYNFKTDKKLSHNLIDSGIPQLHAMEQRAKAIIQQYMGRMQRDELLAEKREKRKD